MRIVVATKNKGKMRELRELFEGSGVTLTDLADYPGIPDVEEDGQSFFENAFKKARTISEKTGEVVVADDSGLVVDYLDGRPGIYSSRYSGPNATDETNIELLLQELRGVPEGKRGAAFICALVIYRPEGEYQSFEGKLAGMIAKEPKGTEGFGYDPVFFVPDYGMTVAQMDPSLKNRISHRAKAFNKLKKTLLKDAK